MNRAMVKRRGQTYLRALHDDEKPDMSMISTDVARLGPWRQGSRGSAPIVRLPVGEHGCAPRADVVARAEVSVRQSRGWHVDEERYLATLHAASGAPAAMLAALVDAAGEVEKLRHESDPDEHVIIHITIRR
jgi:hypothetical protein